MSFRFYRRINILPGLSLNLGKKGASVSVGPRGAKMTFGPRGTRASVGLPGTGMRYEKYFGRRKEMSPSGPNSTSAILIVLSAVVSLLSFAQGVTSSSSSWMLLCAASAIIFVILLLAQFLFPAPSNGAGCSSGGYVGMRQKSTGGERTSCEMADACRSLYRFLQEIDRNPRCRQELNETPGLEGIGADGDQFTIGQKLGFIVFCDLRDIYTRLGHSTRSLHNREGVGYAMMVLLLISRDLNLSCFNDSQKASDVLRIVEDLSRTDVGHITIQGHEEEMRFALIFGKIHHEQDWVDRYATLLYRWASLVAKANGAISTSESEVLNSIMSLRAEGETSGVSGNVRVSGCNADQNVAKRNSNAVESGTRSGDAQSLSGEYANAFRALKELIGLEPVKREVRKLASFIDIQRKREKSGLRAAPVSYHCVFTGNPGTGKTTVARILAEIYREMGVVKKGHLVETDRSGLIGEYVGQTAVKTNRVIDSALDGILFIDEAYSLIQGDEKDFGREAIATLLKRMEDDRKRLVVILAGYTDEMKKFIDSNPGLQSRFNRYIQFPDYNAEELAKIFLKKTAECQYTCDKDVRASIVDIMRKAVAEKDKNFGNGRFVRNLFENAIQRQAVRLSNQSPLTAEVLAELTLHDLGFAYEEEL